MDFLSQLHVGHLCLLLFALAIAFAFEFVNGFHDTANAVATVIYTNTLKPTQAVVWSGIWNFIGVLAGGIAVAYGIVHLLPLEVLVQSGTNAGLVMVLSLLIGAIVWNWATWYVGLPSSSSHALIGAILGVGVAHSLVAYGDLTHGVNWNKGFETFAALLFSPLVGFTCAAILLLVLRFLVRNPKLYAAPEGSAPPPLWIRSILVLTCTGVSYAHGSNDGQKGMGLVMLALIAVVPAYFALDLHTPTERVSEIVQSVESLDRYLRDDLKFDDKLPSGKSYPAKDNASELGADARIQLAAMRDILRSNDDASRDVATLSELTDSERTSFRQHMFNLDSDLSKLRKLPEPVKLSDNAKKSVSMLREPVEYVPWWVKLGTAFALGFGTMVAWKRIVVTVGEKIGKSHLTYAQGASAELVTYATIQAAVVYGLPVSTTHVLSSSVAGTMAANGSGLQWKTVRNLLLAWALTLPATMLMSGGLYAIARVFVT